MNSSPSVPNLVPEADGGKPVDLGPVADVSVSAPSPLDKEPVEPNTLSASPPRKDRWLFCYGFKGCGQCVHDDPIIDAWANRNGLTVSQANLPDSRLARVQHVDLYRDRPQRDISFGKTEAMYPTYVIVDQTGATLWYHVGLIDEYQLDHAWRQATK